MTLVEQDSRGEARRRIVPESVAELREDGRTGAASGGRHGVEDHSVVKADVAAHIAAIDQKMKSF